MKYSSQCQCCHFSTLLLVGLFLLIITNTLPLAQVVLPPNKVTRAYVKSSFASLRQSSSEDGVIVTNIPCGEEVQILSTGTHSTDQNRIASNELVDLRWQKVQFANQVGHIKADLLSIETEPQCDSVKYSTFFWKLGLDIIDMSQWASLEEKINRYEVK